MLNNNDYKQLLRSSTSTQALYGLPKVHKPAVPLGPILSAISSFNHKAVKGLPSKLFLLRDHPTNFDYSFTFMDNIKDK